MDVEVTHGVQNPAQEANIVQLLKKSSGFYAAQKLHYHAGLPLVAIQCQISLFCNPIFSFLYALWVWNWRHAEHLPRPQLLLKRVSTVTSAITHVSLTQLAIMWLTNRWMLFVQHELPHTRIGCWRFQRPVWRYKAGWQADFFWCTLFF